MNPPPLITVITVCRDAEATIVEAMASVAGQSHPRVEHLVIDGASRDGTVAAARAAARPSTRIVSEPDRGIYDAMNKGLRLATGEIVGCLNADDVFADPHALACIAAAFADPAVGICYGDLVYVAQDDPERIVRYWSTGRITAADLAFALMPAHPTFYVRRSLLARLGPFDLSFASGNDFEFTARYLHAGGVRARYLPRVLVRMRLGGVSNRSLRQVLRQNLDILKALRRLRITPSFLLPLGKLLVKARQFIRRPAGGRAAGSGA